LISYKKHQSIYTYNYNPSFADLKDRSGKTYAEGLFVRSQNTSGTKYGVKQSVITLAVSSSKSKKFDDLENI
jgi:hypothetical protein